MLGMRPRLDWGPMQVGLFQTLKEWKLFSTLSEDERKIGFSQYRGANIMFQDIFRVVEAIDSGQYDGYLSNLASMIAVTAMQSSLTISCHLL